MERVPGLKILVVDDEPVILRTTRLVLEHSGYSVVTAPSAEEALVLCQTIDGTLSLVISDISMPGMNGRDFANCVSALPRPIPVILMSGFSETSPLLKGLHGGRMDNIRFIAKPFRAKDLLDLVSLAISESASN